MTSSRIIELNKVCNDMRRDCLIMADAAGDSGLHFGGTLSLIEIVAVLYMEVINLKKESLDSNTRDRIILSKGHGVPAIYSALKQMDVLTDDELRSFKKEGSNLSGHPSMNSVLGIEFSAGSLGQGLSQGVGVALAMKHYNNNAKVYVIVGDGECDEGSIWEAAMSAHKFKLDNLILIIDKNKIQYDGNTEDVMPLMSLTEKWKSFGWKVIEINGHNVAECSKAFKEQTEQPLVVIANTIKGKGISFMENNPSWHHAKLTKEQRALAWEEISND